MKVAMKVKMKHCLFLGVEQTLTEQPYSGKKREHLDYAINIDVFLSFFFI